MTHHTDAELLRDIEEHMRKMWDARLLPAVCWPADLAQRLTQAVRRAPAAPVPQGVLEAAQRAHDWMDSQADSQSKGNFHSFDLLCLRQERDALAEALAAAPQPPEAAPSSVSNGRCPDAPPQENIREGAPYSDPEFEKLAREHAVWGTAQSALCAQFWLAALAQRVPLSDRKIRQIDAHSGLDAIEFARAIERAHGITQEKQG